MGGRVSLICEECGESFSMIASRHRQDGTRFCSRNCFTLYRRRTRTITPPEQRFWIKVEKTPSCWIWTGALYNSGYGAFGVTSKDTRSAHRYSYEISHGPIPGGLQVLHTCDNRPCVRPDHLFLGTQLENIHDMIGKGWRIIVGLKGERNGGAKLTTTHVREIRTRYAAGGITQRELAQEFSVQDNTISAIISRRLWSDV